MTTTSHRVGPHRAFAGLSRARVADFRDIHADSVIIVCGCGESLNELTRPERFITIGVNDVGRRFQPNYLVVVNPPNQFSGDRFSYVESSQAEYLFTQLKLGLSRENIIKFQLGTYGGTDFSNPDVLHHTQNSPYVALCLAVHMGARRIGLIGVDFTEHHFFARTGTHSLTPQLAIIDKQYKRLGEAIKARGVEVFNLSGVSRLTAFPKSTLEDLITRAAAPATASSAMDVPVAPGKPIIAPNGNGASRRKGCATTPSSATIFAAGERPRVFGVDYHFITCGEVFGTGLRNGAADLGITYEGALWDDPQLAAKIDRFRPDLLFVVHGRRFAQKWGTRFSNYRTAVWLVDEPYEVDDTARWSNVFETVFVNDPNTLSRHRNAHYLPVCFNGHVHRDKGLPRPYKVGFIGGYNETRERLLNEIARAGLLSYVVGGPWRSQGLQRLSLGTHVLPEKATELYQQSRVIVNIFREVHHYNRERVPARSLNPRIYEALACGALVLSEERPELREMLPDLPTFENSQSMADTLMQLLADEAEYRKLLEKSRAKLAGHSYSDRLAQALRICLGSQLELTLPAKEDTRMSLATGKANWTAAIDKAGAENVGEISLAGWFRYGEAAQVGADGTVVLSKQHSPGPGSETGLVSEHAYDNVELSFDLWLDADTWFIAKIHQLDRVDQKANSYHFVSEPKANYVAKHHHIFCQVPITRGVWQAIVFRHERHFVEVHINGGVIARVPDHQLRRGYCFIGVKGGRAKLKKIQVTDLSTVLDQEHRSTGVVAQQTKIDAGLTQKSELPAPGVGSWPFSLMPRRNLIYHIWPVRGAMWQWNLEQLKKRIDIFNGRRIIGIVHDDRSVPPEEVKEFLAGHGFEFIIAKNDERGEAITFPLMMREVASVDPNEITFYGHAKGVKYEPNVPVPVKRWAEVQYRVALDDWFTIREHLQRFAMTGSFRRPGRFGAHRNLADWHYSGTYFWMRNAHVFTRNYSEVPQFYGGVETWPGTIFRKSETACLFIDDVSQHPYYQDFWRNMAEGEFRRWESTVRPFPPPSDLVQPLPYKSYTEPRMEQNPDEFDWWVRLLLQEQVSSVLTIGSRNGGVEWHLAREFFEHDRKIEITAIEKDFNPQLAQTFSDAERRFHQTLRLVIADSTSPSIRAQLADHYDAVFIDGDHSYRACSSDFVLAKSLNPRLIGLHDVVDSDFHAYSFCCVSRLWGELTAQYHTQQKISGDWGGIGVVIFDRP
jgi:glycosyltransferase involved in cell wall biosynthesis